MNMTVLATNATEVGVSFRKPRSGPENELVQRFLNSSPIPVPPGWSMTVFLEPRLESGFPDLVFVQWQERKTLDWKPERLKLETDDIRVLHALSNGGPVCECALKVSFGRGTKRRLQRLLDADVVSFQAGKWKARPLSKVFAVKQIIAIEAKTDDVRGGLQQAFLNTWFASASYLLTPHVPRSGVIDRAAAFGVGLWSQRAGIIRPPTTAAVPRSHASWLFNEWVWRARFGVTDEIPMRNNEHRYCMAGIAVS